MTAIMHGISCGDVSSFIGQNLDMTCSVKESTARIEKSSGPVDVKYSYLSCNNQSQTLTLFIENNVSASIIARAFDLRCHATDSGLECCAENNDFSFSIERPSDKGLSLLNGHVVASLDKMSESSRSLLLLLTERFGGFWVPSSW